MINPNEKQSLYNYINGICQNNNITIKAIGGIENHIHILLILPPTISLSKAMQFIKGGSSKWMNENRKRGNFEWQNGYGAFSIGSSQLKKTVDYIGNQEAHHKTKSFQNEYSAFLRKNKL